MQVLQDLHQATKNPPVSSSSPALLSPDLGWDLIRPDCGDGKTKITDDEPELFCDEKSNDLFLEKLLHDDNMKDSLSWPPMSRLFCEMSATETIDDALI
jgi:hypothetical protein